MTSSEPGGIAVPDTPQTADTDAPPPSSGAPVTKRAHRFLVPVLLVLATIVGIAGGVCGVGQSPGAEHVELVFDERQGARGQAGPDRAQRLLGARAVHATSNVSADLQKVLPTQLQPLAGPAAAGLQQLAGQARPEGAGQPAGAGRVGSGQRRRAQAAVEGAERGRAGRLDPVRGRDPELAHARQPARRDARRLEPGRRGAVEAAGLDRGVGPGRGAAEARDHAAACQRPAGDHARKSAGDGAGHRQRRQGPGDRAAGDRAPAVRARRVSRTRTAPADVANERLVLRPDRSACCC